MAMSLKYLLIVQWQERLKQEYFYLCPGEFTKMQACLDYLGVVIYQ